ncbi:MAG: GNAT family N-acetyltransferase [Bergeyella sp.]
MKFENNKSGNGGVITMCNDTEEIGRLTYTVFPDDSRLIISFVQVYPKHEGKGMGKFLVEEALRFAGENRWKVYPHCSYSRAVMSRMSDIDDIFIK